MNKIWRRTFNKNVPPEISVVIAAYNKPRELQLCLEGYLRQSFWIEQRKVFEIIIADDGSKPIMEETAKRFAIQSPLPVTFLHRPHRGWGKLRMLNWATVESKSEKLIFTDGDCVPHKHFVKSHYENYRDASVGCGRRVDLRERAARSLSKKDVTSGNLGSIPWLITHMLKRDMRYWEQGFFVPSALSQFLSAFSLHRKPSILGCNFSVEKKWLYAVNGFDESFETPGLGEDSDLERRLRLAGLKFHWLTRRAIQFHLCTPIQHAGKQSLELYARLKQEGNRCAQKGIVELIREQNRSPLEFKQYALDADPQQRRKSKIVLAVA